MDIKSCITNLLLGWFMGFFKISMESFSSEGIPECVMYGPYIGFSLCCLYPRGLKLKKLHLQGLCNSFHISVIVIARRSLLDIAYGEQLRMPCMLWTMVTVIYCHIKIATPKEKTNTSFESHK